MRPSIEEGKKEKREGRRGTKTAEAGCAVMKRKQTEKEEVEMKQEDVGTIDESCWGRCDPHTGVLLRVFHRRLAESMNK